MHADIDALLAGLSEREMPSLAGFEEALWSEIHRRSAKDRAWRALGRNSGIAAMALLIGVAVGIARPIHPPKSPNIPLLFTEAPSASLLQ